MVRLQVKNNEEDNNNKTYKKTLKNTKEMIAKLGHGVRETLNNALPSTHELVWTRCGLGCGDHVEVS